MTEQNAKCQKSLKIVSTRPFLLLELLRFNHQIQVPESESYTIPMHLRAQRGYP